MAVTQVLQVLAGLSLLLQSAIAARTVHSETNIGEDVSQSVDGNELEVAYLAFFQEMSKPEIMHQVVPGCSTGCWVYGPMLCLDSTCCSGATPPAGSCPLSVEEDQARLCVGSTDINCVISAKLGQIPVPEGKMEMGLQIYASTFPKEADKIKRTKGELTKIITSGMDFEKVDMPMNGSLMGEGVFTVDMEDEELGAVNDAGSAAVQKHGLSPCTTNTISLTCISIGLALNAHDVGAAWNQRVAAQYFSSPAWAPAFETLFDTAIRPMKVGVSNLDRATAVARLIWFTFSTSRNFKKAIATIVQMSLTNMWWWEVATTAVQVTCSITAMVASHGVALIAKLVSLNVGLLQFAVQLPKTQKACS